MIIDQSMVGLGAYTLPEAAQLIGATSFQVRRWALGYDFLARSGETRKSPPVLLAEPHRLDNQNALTFRQMIELRFVRMFRNFGVAMPVIRAAARNAASQYDTDLPFGMHRFYTDGKSIFASMTPDEVSRGEEEVSEREILQQLDKAQMVMEIARVYFHGIAYERDEARRWWILGSPQERALIDPNRGFGQPIDGPTGVPLTALYGPLRAGDSMEKVADWYEVPLAAVETAIRFYDTFPHLFRS